MDKPLAIFFDNTGSGRTPEPVAGPFLTRAAAEAYAEEYGIDLTDPNYFIDDAPCVY